MRRWQRSGRRRPGRGARRRGRRLAPRIARWRSSRVPPRPPRPRPPRRPLRRRPSPPSRVRRPWRGCCASVTRRGSRCSARWPSCKAAPPRAALLRRAAAPRPRPRRERLRSASRPPSPSTRAHTPTLTPTRTLTLSLAPTISLALALALAVALLALAPSPNPHAAPEPGLRPLAFPAAAPARRADRAAAAAGGQRGRCRGARRNVGARTRCVGVGAAARGARDGAHGGGARLGLGRRGGGVWRGPGVTSNSGPAAGQPSACEIAGYHPLTRNISISPARCALHSPSHVGRYDQPRGRQRRPVHPPEVRRRACSIPLSPRTVNLPSLPPTRGVSFCAS